MRRQILITQEQYINRQKREWKKERISECKRERKFCFILLDNIILMNNSNIHKKQSISVSVLCIRINCRSFFFQNSVIQKQEVSCLFFF
jgi:hypothetical protein